MTETEKQKANTVEISLTKMKQYVCLFIQIRQYSVFFQMPFLFTSTRLHSEFYLKCMKSRTDFHSGFHS